MHAVAERERATTNHSTITFLCDFLRLRGDDRPRVAAKLETVLRYNPHAGYCYLKSIATAMAGIRAGRRPCGVRTR